MTTRNEVAERNEAAERLYRAYWRARWDRYRQAVPLQWEQLDESERLCWEAAASEALAAERRATVERIRAGLPTSGRWGIRDIYAILDEELANATEKAAR